MLQLVLRVVLVKREASAAVHAAELLQGRACKRRAPVQQVNCVVVELLLAIVVGRAILPTVQVGQLLHVLLMMTRRWILQLMQLKLV